MFVVQESTVEEAMDSLRSSGHTQPCLFKCQGSFYCKVDHTAILLSSASCFTEAVEFTFFCFWVFNVEYPAPLRFFYAFIERVLGVGSPKNSAVLRDFFRALAEPDTDQQ